MPKITHYPGRVEIEVPYNVLLVNDLKIHIPPRQRSYDPIRHVWSVWGYYVPKAVEIVQTYIPNVEIVGEPRPFKARSLWEYEGNGKYGSKRRRPIYEDGEIGDWEHNPDYDASHADAKRSGPHTEAPEWEWEYNNGGIPLYSAQRRKKYRDGRRGPWEDNPTFFRNSQGYRQERQNGPTANGSVDNDRRHLYVTDDAPEAIVKAAYKVLAIAYHPDRSTDPNATRKMQDLNAAYDRLKKRNGWK